MLGTIKVKCDKKRLDVLSEIYNLLDSYFKDLKQYRKSIWESFSGRGLIADAILDGNLPSVLLIEERNMIVSFVDKLKVSTYKESIDLTDALLQKIQEAIVRLKGKTLSQGRALPLVTGMIAFLIAILLF